jgi:hypothetical protein
LLPAPDLAAVDEAAAADDPVAEPAADPEPLAEPVTEADVATLVG